MTNTLLALHCFGIYGFHQPNLPWFYTLPIMSYFTIGFSIAVWLTFTRFRPRTGYSENMSPDSTSSLFPDRPIRPLPKRTIRQRLSPEVAKTIKYPPAPQNIPPLFAYPYNAKEDSGILGSEPPSVTNRENASQLGQEAALRRNGLSGEYHEESLVGQARRALISRPFQDGAFRTPQRPQRPLQARHNAIQPPPSATSSVDGYDSFENTNNKKKRKIPTAGESILNGTHVLNDSSALGMPSPPTTGDEGPGDSTSTVPTPYYQSGGASVSTQGISGPGRGRYGRTRNGRSPLRTLPDPNNAWNGRTPKLRGPGQCPSPPGGKSHSLASNPFPHLFLHVVWSATINFSYCFSIQLV